MAPDPPTDRNANRYHPTDAECRCRLCGARMTHPALWLDTAPPDRNCKEGAERVTDCQTAMQNALASAWLIKAIGDGT